MNTLAQEYGTALRAARLKNRLTQRELAGLLGTDVGTVSRWERGLFLPNFTAAQKLGALFAADMPFSLALPPDDGSAWIV